MQKERYASEREMGIRSKTHTWGELVQRLHHFGPGCGESRRSPRRAAASLAAASAHPWRRRAAGEWRAARATVRALAGARRERMQHLVAPRKFLEGIL